MMLDLGSYDAGSVKLSLRDDGTISIEASQDGHSFTMNQIRQLTVHHEPTSSPTDQPKVSIEFTTEAPEVDRC